MKKSINLWECLTAQEAFHRKFPENAFGPKITEETLRDLAKNTRFFQQEISIENSDEGWIISLFSTSGENGNCQILISKDARTPVKVLDDTVNKIKHLHD